jgi:hypothetical protein
MMLTTTPAGTLQHDMIYHEIKHCFNDLYYFDDIIGSKLYKAIQECNINDINQITMDKVAERYFDKKLFRTTEQKLVWAQIRIIFKACYVMILSTSDGSRPMIWTDIPTLLMHYPEFHDENVEELCLLLKFRNMLKIALQVIPAENHKNCLLRIAARLEGSRKEYITGGGSKPAVRRRELVFTRESGIIPVKRPEGRKKPQRNIDGSGGGGRVKTSLSSFSMKKVRLVRLASADMKVLGKPMDLFAPVPTSSSSSIPPPYTKTHPIISSTPSISAQHQHALPHQQPCHHSSSAAFDWNNCNASIDIFQYGSPQAYDMNHHHHQQHHHHHHPHHPHQHYDNSVTHHQLQYGGDIRDTNSYPYEIPARPVGGNKRALSIPLIDLVRQESFQLSDLQGLTGLTELLGFETIAPSSSSASPPPPHSEIGVIPIEQQPAPTYPDDLHDHFGGELLSGFSDNSFNFHLYDNTFGW